MSSLSNESHAATAVHVVTGTVGAWTTTRPLGMRSKRCENHRHKIVACRLCANENPFRATTAERPSLQKRDSYTSVETFFQFIERDDCGIDVRDPVFHEAIARQVHVIPDVVDACYSSRHSKRL